MSVSGRSQRKVPGVLLGIARLLERSQHEIGKNSFLGFACDTLGQPLVMPRRDLEACRVDLSFETRMPVAIVARVHPLAARRGQFDAKRLPKRRSDLLKLQHL